MKKTLPFWKKYFFACLLGCLTSLNPLSAAWMVQSPIVPYSTNVITHLVLSTSRSNGNTLIAWIENNNAVKAYYYTTSTDTWTHVLTVNSVRTPSVAVAVAPSGNDAMVIWTDNPDFPTPITINFARESGGWAPQTAVASSPASTIAYELAMDDFGDAALVVTTGGFVGFVTYNSTFDVWDSTFPGTEPATQCHILMKDPLSADNTSLALWTDGSTVKSSYYNGSSWSLPALVTTSTIDGIGLTMTGFSSPNPSLFTAYWNVLVGGINPGVHGKYYHIDTGIWDSQFDPASDPDDTHLKTASDPSPSSIVLWFTSSAPTFYAQVGTPRGSFSVNQFPWQDYGSSAIAVYGAGTYPNDFTRALFAATFLNSFIHVDSYDSTRDIPWAGRLSIYTIPSSHTVSDMVAGLDSANVGFLLWIEHNSSTNEYTVEWARSDAISPVDPPQNPSGRQINCRYFKQSDLVNEIRWDPSPSMGVVGYKLYLVRGTQVTLLADLSTGEESYIYRDHNKQAGIPSTYWITAYNSTTESTVIVTVPN